MPATCGHPYRCSAGLSSFVVSLLLHSLIDLLVFQVRFTTASSVRLYRPLIAVHKSCGSELLRGTFDQDGTGSSCRPRMLMLASISPTRPALFVPHACGLDQREGIHEEGYAWHSSTSSECGRESSPRQQVKNDDGLSWRALPGHRHWRAGVRLSGHHASSLRKLEALSFVFASEKYWVVLPWGSPVSRLCAGSNLGFLIPSLIRNLSRAQKFRSGSRRRVPFLTALASPLWKCIDSSLAASFCPPTPSPLCSEVHFFSHGTKMRSTSCSYQRCQLAPPPHALRAIWSVVPLPFSAHMRVSTAQWPRSSKWPISYVDRDGSQEFARLSQRGRILLKGGLQRLAGKTSSLKESLPDLAKNSEKDTIEGEEILGNGETSKSDAAEGQLPFLQSNALPRSDTVERDRVLLGEKRARLTITLSNNQVHACVVDNRLQRTYAYANSFDPSLRTEIGSVQRKRGWAPRPHGGTMRAARAVGRLLAQRALQKGIKKVFFDRKSYRYIGRVKALADGAREGGLEL
ncbi:putative LSU ribosomal protein L18P [Toxoplasma gondii VEG]|uniref:50S ribosomal protein L18 n=1 Tax=Toxoplasma gondii (strain ATCC 50861 / VEG) TaxID=432359 RepID=V4ZIZ5_TOXGV|nr:putative LSU ribosomal protein L18P [Toxoplasma gondii VEG]CEL76788.1 TPA: 50S ribosomal protein L18 [Toxoplasma gondii VEG]